MMSCHKMGGGGTGEGANASCDVKSTSKVYYLFSFHSIGAVHFHFQIAACY